MLSKFGKISAHWQLITLLLVGLTLRLIASNQSFWLDEAITALQTKSSLHHYLSAFAPTDFHPPGYYVLTWSVAQLVPASEFTLRLPSIIFGTLSIYLVYAIAKRLAPKSALLAAALIATAPLHMYYSQEARMYMMALFFATSAVLAHLKYSQTPSRLNRTVFILCTTLMLYSHYLTVFMLPIFFLTKKKTSRLIDMIIVFILFVPWLPTFVVQIKQGISSSHTAWGSILGYSNVKNILLIPAKFTLGRLPLTALSQLVLALLAPICCLLIYRSWKQPRTHLLFAWLIIPILLTIALSIKLPVLSYFRVIFTLPAMYLLLAIGIRSLKSIQLRNILASLLLLVNVSTTALYLYYPTYHREDWRQAVSLVESTATPNSTVLFAFPDSFAPWQWYQQTGVPVVTTNSFTITSPSQADQIISTITANDQVYVFEYLMDLTDPHHYLLQSLARLGYTEIDTIDSRGVGLIRVFKTKQDIIL